MWLEALCLSSPGGLRPRLADLCKRTCRLHLTLATGKATIQADVEDMSLRFRSLESLTAVFPKAPLLQHRRRPKASSQQ